MIPETGIQCLVRDPPTVPGPRWPWQRDGEGAQAHYDVMTPVRVHNGRFDSIIGYRCPTHSGQCCIHFCFGSSQPDGDACISAGRVELSLQEERDRTVWSCQHCDIWESVHPYSMPKSIYILLFVQMTPEEQANSQSRAPRRDHVCEVEHGTNFDRKDSSEYVRNACSWVGKVSRRHEFLWGHGCDE